MKILLLSGSLLLLTAVCHGQSGFSYGREIRYPTEYNVSRNSNTGSNSRANLPYVEASGFETRKTGTSASVQSVAVKGTVRVAVGPDGKQLAVLQPSNGRALKVATGQVFKLNGHLLKAMGIKNGQYLVYNLTNKNTYAFTQP